jgi:DNA modification methylase
MINNQVITDKYAIYNGDCMQVLPTIKDRSADLIIYSPPFIGLYKYSSLPQDFSNCKDNKEFLDQYEFLVKETARLIKPGRIVAVHCMDIINTSTNQLYDFPHDVIELHEKYGMNYVNKITIWKEPLTVRMRTMVKSLTHKTTVQDCTKAFTAAPDYLLLFKKTGDNEVPVTHPFGFKEYYGSEIMINDMEEKYGTFENLKKKYINHEEHLTNKLSQVIWQRYASSVWSDIRLDNVLPFRESKDEDDEKHVHPLQLDVIQRIVELYTNPGEVVLTPFMGVGSEVYAPVKMGRKAVGIELKESYFKQAIANLQSIKSEDESKKQLSLI